MLMRDFLNNMAKHKEEEKAQLNKKYENNI